MIDEKIARVKDLIRQREEIDAELKTLFGGSAPSRRGRPRKDQTSGTTTSTSVSHTESVTDVPQSGK